MSDKCINYKCQFGISSPNVIHASPEIQTIHEELVKIFKTPKGNFTKKKAKNENLSRTTDDELQAYTVWPVVQNIRPLSSNQNCYFTFPWNQRDLITKEFSSYEKICDSLRASDMLLISDTNGNTEWILALGNGFGVHFLQHGGPEEKEICIFMNKLLLITENKSIKVDNKQWITRCTNLLPLAPEIVVQTAINNVSKRITMNPGDTKFCLSEQIITSWKFGPSLPKDLLSIGATSLYSTPVSPGVIYHVPVPLSMMKVAPPGEQHTAQASSNTSTLNVEKKSGHIQASRKSPEDHPISEKYNKERKNYANNEKKKSFEEIRKDPTVESKLENIYLDKKGKVSEESTFPQMLKSEIVCSQGIVETSNVTIEKDGQRSDKFELEHPSYAVANHSNYSLKDVLILDAPNLYEQASHHHSPVDQCKSPLAYIVPICPNTPCYDSQPPLKPGAMNNQENCDDLLNGFEKLGLNESRPAVDTLRRRQCHGLRRERRLRAKFAEMSRDDECLCHIKRMRTRHSIHGIHASSAVENEDYTKDCRLRSCLKRSNSSVAPYKRAEGPNIPIHQLVLKRVSFSKANTSQNVTSANSNI